MKRVLIILISMTAVACSTKLDEWELLRAESICKDKEGIDYIRIDINNYVRCKNGQLAYLKP